jgi:hypothetical protein
MWRRQFEGWIDKVSQGVAALATLTWTRRGGRSPIHVRLAGVVWLSSDGLTIEPVARRGSQSSWIACQLHPKCQDDPRAEVTVLIGYKGDSLRWHTGRALGTLGDP